MVPKRHGDEWMRETQTVLYTLTDQLGVTAEVMLGGQRVTLLESQLGIEQRPYGSAIDEYSNTAHISPPFHFIY
jgi:hypothetical protein